MRRPYPRGRPSRRPAILGGVPGRARIVGAAAAVSLLAAAGCGAREPAPEPPRIAGAPLRPVDGAAAQPHGRFQTARLLEPVLLRDAPGGRRLARLGTRTEFGSPTVLAVVRRRGDWLAVLTIHRRRAAWIPRRAARLRGTDRWLRVDRSARRLELREGARVLRRVRVAVGRADHPTPLGRYAITDALRMRRGGPYGCCALALTGRQARLPRGWPGGDRLAIHGTIAPASIGRAASLGCMRAADRDVRALTRALPLGAPVVVRA
jgi:lipoprotein-anchoring transpeptidase ErfK/SrfK